MGPASREYGSEQPTVISMGSCANAISKIVWQDWGSPEAHGSGLGCVQTGSRLGTCWWPPTSVFAKGCWLTEPCKSAPTRRRTSATDNSAIASRAPLPARGDQPHRHYRAGPQPHPNVAGRRGLTALVVVHDGVGQMHAGSQGAEDQ